MDRSAQRADGLLPAGRLIERLHLDEQLVDHPAGTFADHRGDLGTGGPGGSGDHRGSRQPFQATAAHHRGRQRRRRRHRHAPANGGDRTDLLHEAGPEAETIQKLKKDQNSAFYARLIYHWYEWAAAELSVRSAYIFVRRFGLDGQPPARLAAIGQELGISRERVRQLETKILQRLR